MSPSKRKLVIFGAGKIAEQAYFCFAKDSDYEVCGFAVDAAYRTTETLFGLPVIPADRMVEQYPPSEFHSFVALGYQDLNRLRTTKVAEMRGRGYTLATYISSRASNIADVPVGENCLILENSVLQVGSQVGSNVFIWSGCHVGHHATVRDNCYLAGQVVVSGSSIVEESCFLGVNCTIGHQITVGAECVIGAGALILKNAAPGSVYIEAETAKFRLDSRSFLRLTKLER